MDNSKEELIFFNRAGSICTHAEEMLGTDLFIRLTQKQVTVNPLLTFPSVVMYINRNGKRHYKIFCVNGKYGIQVRVSYFLFYTFAK